MMAPSQSYDHKTQEGIHLAFLAATDFLSGENSLTKVWPELFVVMTRKQEAKRVSEMFWQGMQKMLGSPDEQCSYFDLQVSFYADNPVL